jgi:hypothetical protein
LFLGLAACDPDGDGFRGVDDCDESDPAINLHGVEQCNGKDDDCNGIIDDHPATAPAWYYDDDDDGHGDPAISQEACDPVNHWVALGDDCDDHNAYAWGPDDDLDGFCANQDCDDEDPLTNGIDGDGDGYCGSDDCKDADPTIHGTDDDGDTFCASEDCNDLDAATHPGAVEWCDNADNNCDGSVDEGTPTEFAWFRDADADGSGDPADVVTTCIGSPPDGYVWNDLDCDDQDPARYAGADEICNGVDDDCDGQTDDDDAFVTGAPAWYLDGDGDAFGDPASATFACAAQPDRVEAGGDCNDGDPAIHPGAPETDCSDPTDYNCDGSVQYVDADHDGWAACEDCDDGNSGISPGATEVCGGGDEDCDLAVDDADPSVDPASFTRWYRDADHDGFGDDAAATDACAGPPGALAIGGDCNDGDAAVNPGETELCDNGIDDDCDGGPDPTVLDYYRDADNDGYGVPPGVQSCGAPPGYVLSDADCNDASPAVHPGHVEVCANGADDDCDGNTDPPASNWYPDDDADGFGDETAASAGCGPPPGYIADGTDCDDAHPTVNPAAIEVCGDGIDNDCDPAFAGCLAMGALAPADALATLTGRFAGDSAGAAVAVGDFDGDGTVELSVGAPLRNVDDRGEAYVVPANVRGVHGLGTEAIWQASGAGANTGAALAGHDDLDGDGIDDLLVGAPGLATVYVVPHATAGGSLAAAPLAIDGTPTASFGIALGTGDFDGDGSPDALVGSHGEAGYAVPGPLAGAPVLADAEITVTNPGPGGFASVAASAGDVDGDGIDDLLFGTSSGSAAWLFLGGLPGVYTTADATTSFTPELGGTCAGASVGSAGDVDADGLADLAIGDCRADRGALDGGAVYLVSGLATGVFPLNGALAAVYGADPGARLGAALAAADVDADGAADLVAGGSGGNGAAWLFYGPLAGIRPSTSSDLEADGAAAGDCLGCSIDLGDVDGDGTLDLLLGGPGVGGDAGAAWLFATGAR